MDMHPLRAEFLPEWKVRITQSQLESYLWGAAVLLRGTIDAGDYKQFIFPLLFYKRLCDTFDEETQIALAESGEDKEFAAFPENHRFQIPPEAHWREVRQAARDVGHVLQSSLRVIETANPDKLYGIFGDAQWTNKDRLTDAMLHDLIEHFSSLELTVANLPEDELGQGYEYLIKKFADDSGHTAAEFYTNRTVVHLMTEMLQPQPVESIYDPTCGSGGMLLSCITQLRRQGKEWRNVRLYGQERNLMTSSIARMNCFLHGIEDFRIERGDTLSEPKFVQGDRLKQFDVVLANPPYSIKQWDRAAFASDPWGRNLYGTPPQGRADYAFWQHIVCSLSPKTGRCAILFPHGVLFRQEEADMRRKLIDADLIECVLGLGPNLFYNSSMEACVVICRTDKPKERRGKILFINAINEVTRERTQSFLRDEHIQRIVKAYEQFKDATSFAKVASLENVRKNGHSLKIDLYIATPCASNGNSDETEQQSEFPVAMAAWSNSCFQVHDLLSSHLYDLDTAYQPGRLRFTVYTEYKKRFDRSMWQSIRFGNVVRMLKEEVYPGSGEVNRYVAGEHMETENVHIRKWGTVGNGYLGPAFIRRFRKGQVLYGSRRTYLKKVAMAEFDGVTANTTFVLQADEGTLLQELLPWLMLSERFTQHSIRESKGSTNPYINFSDIAKFEFDLPPLDQQRRIAEILWAVDDHKTKLERAYIAFERYHAAYTERHFGTQCSRTTLGSLAQNGNLDIQTGPFGTVLKASSYVTTGTPIINPVNIVKHCLDIRDGPFLTSQECERLKRYKMKTGDILLGRKGDVGRAVFVRSEYDGFIVGSDIIRLRLIDSELRPEYLYYFLLAPKTRSWIARQASGTTMPGINEKLLKKIEVPIPTKDIQATIIQTIESMNVAEESLLAAISASKDLYLSLANAVMDGSPQ
jgi:type I restriction enzyme M protein